ncbi:MAG: beta-1,6-N-acetylglucosaminyltransferase, partial [Elioraea sp.]|nr:beta-1,6-N-acetylglucosaminyltransferase [Elioraea sp.]
MMSRAAESPRLAFLVLAHERLDLVQRLLRRLVSEGDAAFVHVDAKVPAEAFAAFRAEAERSGPGPVTVIDNRVRCAWGDWSLVEATLRLIEAAEERVDAAPTHLYLLSGADYPTRPLAMLRRFLADRPGQDFIECVPMHVARWNDTWLLHERYWYRHYFHLRRQRRLFRWSMRLQEQLGLRRRFPAGLVPCLGSQWWCLRRATARAVAARLREPALARFFRTTWVPDELAIQSVAHAVSDSIANRLLTYYEFTDYGVPLVLHDGQEAFVLAQPYFFARKLSPYAEGLRA